MCTCLSVSMPWHCCLILSRFLIPGSWVAGHSGLGKEGAAVPSAWQMQNPEQYRKGRGHLGSQRILVMPLWLRLWWEWWTHIKNETVFDCELKYCMARNSYLLSICSWWAVSKLSSLGLSSVLNLHAVLNLYLSDNKGGFYHKKTCANALSL
jgi:hypothetical protein